MTKIFEVILVGGMVGVAVQIFISNRRHKRDFREYLEPILKQTGVDFMSSAYPGTFKVGPFPKFETESGRPQSNINGIRGEYNEYRIVRFKDSGGRICQLWAVIEFEGFQFRRVRWRAEQKNSLPQGVLSILEN